MIQFDYGKKLPTTVDGLSISVFFLRNDGLKRKTEHHLEVVSLQNDCPLQNAATGVKLKCIQAWIRKKPL